MGGFRDDPDWPLVAALEVFDDESQQARPAAIFTDRVIDPPTERHGVDTADEAVAVCLDESGAVAIDRVAELLGTDPVQGHEPSWVTSSSKTRPTARSFRPRSTSPATSARSSTPATRCSTNDPS